MVVRPVDFQQVSLHVRNARVAARVVSVHGGETVLSIPRGLPAAARPLPADAELSFEYRSQLLMISGQLLADPDESSARFRVDESRAPRELRRHVRLSVGIEAVVTPQDPPGPPETLRTLDLSAGGVLLQRAGLQGRQHVALSLPGGFGAVEATGAVVRSDARTSAVRFDHIEPAAQATLDAFVLGVRRQLARRFGS